MAHRRLARLPQRPRLAKLVKLAKLGLVNPVNRVMASQPTVSPDMGNLQAPAWAARSWAVWLRALPLARV